MIRNIHFRAQCQRSVVPTALIPEPPCAPGRLRRKALTAAVAASGLLHIVVGVRHARHVCAPIGLGPLVAWCTQCKTRWSPHSVAAAVPGRCKCSAHVVFTFLAGALTEDDVKCGRVVCPDKEEFVIVRMKDVLHSDNTLTSLLRTFSLGQTGSKLERARRLGRALLATDSTGTHSVNGAGFPSTAEHGTAVPVVSVKLCADGAAILQDGRQITTTSFVVLAEGGSGQSTDHHHILVRCAVLCMLVPTPHDATTGYAPGGGRIRSAIFQSAGST